MFKFSGIQYKYPYHKFKRKKQTPPQMGGH